MPGRNYEALVKKYKIPDGETSDKLAGAQPGTPEPGTVAEAEVAVQAPNEYKTPLELALRRNTLIATLQAQGNFVVTYETAKEEGAPSNTLEKRHIGWVYYLHTTTAFDAKKPSRLYSGGDENAKPLVIQSSIERTQEELDAQVKELGEKHNLASTSGKDIASINNLVIYEPEIAQI